MNSSHKNHLVSGFSLIELVIVIVLIGILAGMLFTVISGPMQAFVQIEQRARLVDIAATALQRMTREIRLALPYSIRVSGGNAIEFLRTFGGGRYRRLGPGRLRFSNNNNSQTFSVLSPLDNPAVIQANSGAGSSDCIASNAFCLVIFNIGQPLTTPVGTPSLNAYLGTSAGFDGNIATISGTGVGTDPLGFDELSFDNSDIAGWNFAIASLQQRFHIVDTAVSFICSGLEINRYAGYAIAATQPVPPGVAPNLLIDRVTSCNFTLALPTIDRAGLLKMSITITDSNLGESVTLLQQVHLDNLP